MGSLLGFALGGWLAWSFGLPFSTAFLGDWWWLGTAVTFLAGYLAARAVVLIIAFRLMMSGGGLWSSVIGRRLVGTVADGLIILLQFAVTIWLSFALNIYQNISTNIVNNPKYSMSFIEAVIIGLWMMFVFVYLVSIPLIKPFKIAIGRYSRPLRNLWRSAAFGVGGSSSYAGLLEEWANPWRPGDILLGTSLYDPTWKVGKPDDRHQCTIATSRSGKGRSAIIPNLLKQHPDGSALVIDPKGQNAAVTAAARHRMGQAVHVIDPFGVLENIGVYLPVRCFNPLAEVDIEASDAVEQIENLARALVVPSPNANPFWDNASTDIITGVIAHVLTSPEIADEDRHLGTVRHFMTEANGRKMDHLKENMALGGLPAHTISVKNIASATAGGDVMFTVNTHISWLRSLALQKTLVKSDFTMRNIKQEKATIYLVLPPQYLDQHGRFLRLFITQALQGMSVGQKARHSMLFIMDEFYALGPMQILSGSAATIAGYGVKLWPIIQNLSQLQEHYPRNWETFLGNGGMWQAFAVNDQTTADYLSARLGHHLAWRKVNGPNGAEWVPQGATWFRTAVELARESSRDSGNQLVFVEGGDTFLLRRMPYDKAFPKTDYSPDPYEPVRPSRFADAFARWMSGFDPDFEESAESTAPVGQEDAQEAPAAADAPEPLHRTDGLKTASAGRESLSAAPVVAQPARTAAPAPEPPQQAEGIEWAAWGQPWRLDGDGAGQASSASGDALMPAQRPVAATDADRQHDEEMKAWLDSKLPGPSIPPPPLKPPRKRGKGKSL